MGADLFRKRNDQRLRNELAEQFGEELLGPHLRHLTGDALAQHLLGQPRFQIDHQSDTLAVDQGVHRVPAHAERHSAFDAALGETQLAELFAHGFTVDAERRTDIPEQQSVHIFDPETGRHQRRKRRPHRFDRMPRIGRKDVAVAGRTRSGIGNAARGDDNARTLLLALESPLIAVPHAENPTVERHYFGHTGIINDLHAVVHAIFQQCVGNIPRLAASRKHPLAAFDIELHAQPIEESDRSTVVELGESGRKKLGIGTHLSGELLRRPGIGHVAAAFTRNAHLAARFLHLFQQQNPVSVPCGSPRSHHTRSARTDDDHIVRQANGSPFFLTYLFHRVQR